MKVGDLVRLPQPTADCWGINREVILIEKVLTPDHPWLYAWNALASNGDVIEFGRQIEHSSEVVKC